MILKTKEFDLCRPTREKAAHKPGLLALILLVNLYQSPFVHFLDKKIAEQWSDGIVHLKGI